MQVLLKALLIRFEHLVKNLCQFYAITIGLNKVCITCTTCILVSPVIIEFTKTPKKGVSLTQYQLEIKR